MEFSFSNVHLLVEILIEEIKLAAPEKKNDFWDKI